MTNNKVPLVISHAKCMDGRFAAQAAYDINQGAVEIVYEDYHKLGERFASLDIDDRKVYLVDISIAPEYLTNEVVDRTKGIVILDHHKTHRDNWGFTQSAMQRRIETHYPHEQYLTRLRGKIAVFYSSEMSGAEMSWRYFYGSDDGLSFALHVPKLVSYVSDRDLWRFNYPETKAVHEWLRFFDAIGSAPSALTHVIKSFEHDDEERNEFFKIGYMLLSAADNQHRRLAANHRMVNFAGYTVPMASVPKEFAPAESHPFGLTYCDDFKKGIREYSLRSKEGTGVDVEVIAKLYGGGGHATAAGFSMTTKAAETDPWIRELEA
jgi:oligoribonuclease NrnB/cAMP/cGMP phosphodiesterase (DHH superfamily)